jgi:tellurite resistance protein TehA-like permease
VERSRAIAVTLLVRYLRAGPLPFHLGWWAFTFPLGAYAVATITLARNWQVPALEGVATLLYLMLVGFWSVVTARTVTATYSGRIWQR